jgi:DNA-directed RNA polymerase specialized sigma24 family protein
VAQDIPADRLSQISTQWTLLAKARGEPADPDARLWCSLMERYHEAAYRYLHAAARDPDIAAELFQEFALRFLRGDFHRADQTRGRFRDYLKASLRHLVAEYHRRAAARRVSDVNPEELSAPEEETGAASDEAFLVTWRKALLDRAWAALLKAEREGGAPYHSALRLHTDQPDLTSIQLADKLTERLRPAQPFTDAGVRKLIQRARDTLTDLIVEEVARSVPTRDRNRLEEELIELGFHGYCRRALERWEPISSQ